MRLLRQNCLKVSGKPLWLILAGMVLSGAFAMAAHARGTAAGTVIGNQASLYFSTMGVSGVAVKSNTVVFTVEELIDLSVQSIDASAVPTGSPDQSVPLSFRLTNLGNAPEVFRLERATLASPGDFAPTAASVGSIFIENGLQPGFQSAGPFADTRYVQGSNDIALAPDGVQTVYLVNDFSANLNNGAQGRASLRAVSTTPGAGGAVPGKVLAGQGVAGGIAVVGPSSGMAEATGTYLVTGLRVLLNKVQTAVRAPNGGSDLVPGAECDYQIDIQLQGSTGHVDDVLIDDPLPATLRYVSSSLKVNGLAKTDAQDGDEAQVLSEKITVKLGRLVPGNRFVITYTTRLQ